MNVNGYSCVLPRSRALVLTETGIFPELDDLIGSAYGYGYVSRARHGKPNVSGSLRKQEQNPQ